MHKLTTHSRNVEQQETCKTPTKCIVFNASAAVAIMLLPLGMARWLSGRASDLRSKSHGFEARP